MRARTSRAGTSNSSARRGFTLFELMLVLVLLALVAGLAAPAVGMMETRGGLETAAVRIRGAVHETRTRAMLSRRPAELLLAGRRVEMALAATDEAAREIIGSAELPEGVGILAVRVQGEPDETPGNTLDFHPRGLTLPAVIQLSDGKNDLTLYVPPLADVTIHDGLKSLETATLDYSL